MENNYHFRTLKPGPKSVNFYNNSDEYSDQLYLQNQSTFNTNQYSNQKPTSPDDDNFERGNDNSFLEEFT